MVLPPFICTQKAAVRKDRFSFSPLIPSAITHTIQSAHPFAFHHLPRRHDGAAPGIEADTSGGWRRRSGHRTRVAYPALVNEDHGIRHGGRTVAIDQRPVMDDHLALGSFHGYSPLLTFGSLPALACSPRRRGWREKRNLFLVFLSVSSFRFLTNISSYPKGYCMLGRFLKALAHQARLLVGCVGGGGNPQFSGLSPVRRQRTLLQLETLEARTLLSGT